MKIFATVMKIVAALAAIAGIVYIVATYGDKIVAWAKQLLAKCGYCEPEEITEEDIIEEEVPEEAAEADAVQAEETDFEG